MSKLMRWSFAALLLLALWLALILSEFLPRPNAAEQAAMDALADLPKSATGERDGFAAAWSLGFAVPQDQIEAVLKADLEAYDTALRTTGTVSNFQSTAEARFATVAVPNGKDPALCETWNPDCLSRVRAAPEATRQRLHDFSARLTRSRWLAAYDYFHYPFTPRFDAPIASLGGLFNLQLSEAVLLYVDGQVDQAFATLCRDTSVWRRFRARSDMLVHDMIGIAQMSAAAQIYAQFLAEQPAAFSPPCPEVFAPLADAELDQCAVMRFEYLSTENTLNSGGALLIGQGAFARGQFLLANRQHLLRLQARSIGRFCQADHRAQIASRDPARPVVAEACSFGTWLVDPAGCAMIDKISIDYQLYYWRALDLDARLRLLGADLWLRGATNGNVASRFAERPASLDSPAHQFELDGAAGKLRLRNLESNRGQYWELPLLVARPEPGP